jgi:hypothetical protein
MSALLPEEIQVETTPKGIYYRLPLKKLTRLQIRFILIFFCLGIVSGAVAVGLCFLMFGGNEPQYLFLLPVAILFGLIAIFLLTSSRSNLYRKTEFCLNETVLEIKEWVGRGCIPSSIQRGRICAITAMRLVYSHETIPPNEPTTSTGMTTTHTEPIPLGGIVIVCDDKLSLLAASDYPLAWLSALSSHLADLLQVTNKFEKVEEIGNVVGQLPEDPAADDPDAIDVTEAPQDNRWKSQKEGMRVQLTLPPKGLFRREHAGLMGMSIFFLVVAGFLFYRLQEHPQPSPWAYGFIALMLAFVPIPLAIAWRRGQTSVELSADGDRLTFKRTTAFGTEQHFEWKREELTAIRAGASLFEGHGVPRKALFLFLTHGKKRRLLEDDRGQEILWLATVLREAMHLPAVVGVPPKSQP